MVWGAAIPWFLWALLLQGTFLGVLILTFPHRPFQTPLTPRPSPEQALGACLEARPRPSFLKRLNTYRASPAGFLHVCWLLRWGEGRPAASRWIT